jgi:hypothetical protein
MPLFGPADNRITPADRARAYQILGFGIRAGARTVPESLSLAALMDATRLLELHTRAQEEYRGGQGGARRGLTEYRVGLELLADPAPARATDQTADRPSLCLTAVSRGRANHGGREVDRSRTILGTIHTHPWDVAQSIADVRNLVRANDILGGVVTYTGRMTLLVKHPDAPARDRSPFASELELQATSLQEAPDVLRRLGVLGALSAGFDLPIRSTRDPYIWAICRRLGLLAYVGDVASPTLRRD